MKTIDDLLENLDTLPAKILTTALDILIFRHNESRALITGTCDRTKPFEVPRYINEAVDVILKCPYTRKSKRIEKLNLHYNNPHGITSLNIPILWGHIDKMLLEIVNSTHNTIATIKNVNTEGPIEILQRGELKFIWRDEHTKKIFAMQSTTIDYTVEHFYIQFPKEVLP